MRSRRRKVESWDSTLGVAALVSNISIEHNATARIALARNA